LRFAAIGLLMSAALELLAPAAAMAAGEAAAHSAKLFMWIAVVLIAAKIGCLVDRVGQPMVLGELLMGIVLGNLALIGVPWFEEIRGDGTIKFLADLGVVILLFQIGLESSVESMRKVGVRAILVALLGVVLPFLVGTWLAGPWLLPGMSFEAYLFLGATLTATSVGITGRVFSALDRLRMPEALIVLGAAVLDDVLGLVVLAVVSAIVSTGAIDPAGVALILGKALAFLMGALMLGRWIAPRVSGVFARIHTGVGMKFTLAICTCLVFAFLAQQMGLAAIVGAFAAGLVLDEVQFRNFDVPDFQREVVEVLDGADSATRKRAESMLKHHQARQIEELIAPLGHFVVPFFFVLTGMQVRLDVLVNVQVLLVALGITVAAVLAKVVSGLAAGNVNKWLVGWGMVPRGEVGLIFAAAGMGLGVMGDAEFSAIVLMVILTTLITPPILTLLIRRTAVRTTD
jgi:Kef-type K+ transport system membrane component KefB